MVPTNTARFTWLAPGRIRHIVMALRNSSSLIHFFSTTSTSRDHADSPPPNDASAMWLNVNASSKQGDAAARGCRAAAMPSLMHQFVVVREVVLVVVGGSSGSGGS